MSRGFGQLGIYFNKYIDLKTNLQVQEQLWQNKPQSRQTAVGGWFFFFFFSF